MSLIQDFADWFKRRETAIEKWYDDDVGRFAFRVTVDGQTFVCAARSSAPQGGKISIMQRVAGIAQTNDAYIVVQSPAGMHVFDPVTVLDQGDDDGPTEADRKERGERWIKVDVGLSCSFESWYDGSAEPAQFANIGSF